MPQKGEFPKELIRVYFARLYHQCRFYVLEQEATFSFVLQYLAKLKDPNPKMGKKKSVPKGKEGLQVVLRAETETFFVYILTTVDWKTGTIKDIDEGWVFIVDKREPKKISFYHKPLRRTKNYLDKISDVAEAEFNRVETMPSCPECAQIYTIKLVKLGGGKYGYKIECPNKDFKHEHPTAKSFYFGMGERHKKVLEKGFEEYAKYQAKNEEEGIIRTSSRDIRAKKTKSTGIHHVKEYVDIEPNYD